MLAQLSASVDHFVAQRFYTLGAAIAARPARTIVISLVVAAAALAGFTQYTEENREELLWTPAGSVVLEHKAFVEENYESPARLNQVGRELEAGSFPRSLERGLEVHLELMALETKDGYNYVDLCQPQGSACLMSSVYDVFAYDLDLLRSLDDEAILAALSADDLSTVSGSALDIESVLGGIVRDPETGIITDAGATLSNYFLENREQVSGGTSTDPIADEWEQLFLDVLLPLKSEGFTVSASRSQGDEISDSVTGDLQLVGVGCGLLVLYMAINLGGFRRGESRLLLSVAAVGTAGLAIGCAYGFSSLFEKAGPVHNLIPFLLLGLGIDDAFIIVNSIDQESGAALHRSDPLRKALRSKPLEERLALALQASGSAVTITSLTDAIAFSIGSTTSLPALSSFCIFAAVGVLFLYGFMVTLFTACVYYDTRRAEANGRDCCCCPRAPEDADELAAASEPLVKSGQPTRGFLRQAFQSWGNIVLSTPGRAIVVVCAAVIFSVGVYGGTELEQDFDLRFFIRDSSFLMNHYDLLDDYFQQDVRVDIILDRPLEYSSEDGRASILALRAVLEEADYLTDSFESWYFSFEEALDGELPSDEAEFIAALEVYLAGQGERFATDVVINDGKTQITTSRVAAVAYKETAVKKADDKVDSLLALRKDVSDVIEGAFPYSFEFLLWEQYRVIINEFVTNVLVSLAAVMLVALIMLGHPTVGFLVCLCVILTIVGLLGAMLVCGVVVDGVSVSTVVLATGISVDYTAHLGHGYLLAAGDTRADRMRRAFVEVGAPVLNGAVSTALAVLVLAGSESFIFRTFFLQLISTALLALFHAMAVLPVLLSWFGPLSQSDKVLGAV